jgi:hypothetical protein
MKRLPLTAMAAVVLPVQALAFARDQESRNYQKIGERSRYETISGGDSRALADPSKPARCTG